MRCWVVLCRNFGIFHNAIDEHDGAMDAPSGKVTAVFNVSCDPQHILALGFMCGGEVMMAPVPGVAACLKQLPF